MDEINICCKCKNLLSCKGRSGLLSVCIYGIKFLTTDEITSCSHFKEKPEDTKSKPLASARLSTSCEQPSNHKRIGKMPRKQPKKKEDKKRIPFVGEGNLG